MTVREGHGAGERSAPGGPRHARRWITRAAAETERLGAELAAELGPDGVLLLTGELGSGKTVLARGVAAALGIDPRQVLSPTFNLIREHRGAAGRPPRMVHVDLYRLEPPEAAALGLDEVLAGPGVKVVEWAERLPAASPAGPATLALRLRRLPGGEDGDREIVEIVPEEVERSSPEREQGRGRQEPRRPPRP
ncbi:MAG TPA: tRNA (adenosine(37)-N6)-threonylcarbamoyltransferase complex ATPase subunit type 1 TsaE [Thermoanaerobaculia bacterium]|nr:tRNA (adenosine(37)-N6)-threonylcarbamoyltransferase complex ATPase subunit type 1 TsaE [Thermoanaerobaculia bacterium]